MNFNVHISQSAALRSVISLSAVGFITSSSAQSAPVLQNLELLNANMAMDSAPLIIGAGALVFAVVAMIWLVRARKSNSHTQKTGFEQIAQLRAELDEYEALLACMPEITMLWQGSQDPQLFGETQIFGINSMSLVELLNFEGWLEPTDAIKISSALKQLQAKGQEFSISVHTNPGRIVRAVGRASGDSVIVQLRNASPVAPEVGMAEKTPKHLASVNMVVSMMNTPAWTRNLVGDLVFANKAYYAFCRTHNIFAPTGQIPEIFSNIQIEHQLDALEIEKNSIDIVNPLPDLVNDMKLVLSSIGDASVGCLSPMKQDQSSQPTLQTNLQPILDATNNPLAIFDKSQRLTHFNQAYLNLFEFDINWLSTGLSEREVLDNLRRREFLPAVPDYRAWRAAHLTAYSLDKQRQDIWHLSDGRTLEIVTIPDSVSGGVTYVFNDTTEHLKLQSSNKAMLNVQHQTLNALSEGVAVFGTNGRLQLHNPRLNDIWKLPANGLGSNPHIDQIAQACGKSIPEDGEEIWQVLKTSVIDLDPGRKDKSGRIQRKDGRLIDYAIVRLADSKTMLTFVDVTHSANYENVLKERNDALVDADRLKDAFVQNVSYELRSPLTSIIGFADLLASDNFGPLNDQQRAYTDYIRSSSAILGTLIDNILDLTNVDAGIAELDLKEQDIAQLIDKAKAGFAATMVSSDGAKPLNLKTILPNPLPKFVADGARVVQILYNLLSNAAKFSEPGGQINLTVEKSQDWLRFTIQDEGIGIPENLKNAFAKSEKNNSLKGHQHEAGVGLLIVKAFAELHGGNVSSKPNSATGNQVIVNLPLDASRNQQTAQSA